MNDITKHKWSDGEVQVTQTLLDEIQIEIKECGSYFEFFLNKDDAIAIAKHFKLLENLERDYKRLNDMHYRKDKLIKSMCDSSEKAKSVAREIAGGGLNIILRNANG